MTRPGRWAIVASLMLAACGGAAANAGSGDATPPLDTLPPVSSSETTPSLAPTTTTTTLVTTTTAQPKAPITLGFAGDVSFTHGLHGRDPLGDVTELLTSSDFTAVNLETTVGEPGVGEALDKTYIFRSPPSTVEILHEAGVDVVSLANNHTLDYGQRRAVAHRRAAR